MSSPLSFEKLLDQAGGPYGPLREAFKENLDIDTVTSLATASKTCLAAVKRFEDRSPFRQPLRDIQKNNQRTQIKIAREAKVLQKRIERIN